jgi:cyanophycinase
LLLDAAVDRLTLDGPLSAAYIGASNGDRREFYEIFEAAANAVGITQRRMISSSFGPDDRAFLDCAQLILLPAAMCALAGTRSIKRA